MSALARWFNINGYEVAGYDRTNTPLTTQLMEEGIAIHFEDDLSAIKESFKNTEETLVVLTPAIPKDHKELNYFIESGFTIKKRSEV